MRLYRSIWLTIFSIGIISTGSVEGEGDDLGSGARPLGLGGAFTPIADDANALFFNPSGLAQLQRSEITTMYARLFPGLEGERLSRGLFAYAHPVKNGTFGLGWGGLLTDVFDEHLIVVSYAYRFDHGVMAGLGVKGMLWKADLAQGDVASSLSSGLKVGVDVGLLWVSSWNLKVGAVVKDLNKPNLAKKTTVEDGKLPMEIRVGAAYRLPTATLSGEFVTLEERRKVLLGVERNFSEIGLSIRGGGNWQSLSGEGEWNEATFGFGYEMPRGVVVDYSYAYFLQLREIGGAHRVSFGYRF
ncbi:MAG: conjugal transfer protein TraF [Candidatus Latescibacteria bacterium]|nr:conjugal transfer protein TraF [Candidatus Latescibacterota bacterium]